MRIWKRKSIRRLLVALVLCGSVAYYFSAPSKLFADRNYSTVVYDRNGQLLSASISKDEQWHFQAKDAISPKYKTAVIQFEDKRFTNHWGVDFLALARAFRDNIKNQRIVSGASTITMQTIRLHKNNPPRTIFQKIIEIIQATRIEWSYSKDDIFKMYSNHAPYGGNVIGIDAACWRYFGKSSEQLSWAEAVLLAVLPNSPGLIHTEKNRDRLKNKRNRLLQKLLDTEHIDQRIYKSAILETIPRRPKRLTNQAPHFLQFAKKEGSTSIIRSTIDKNIQEKCNQIAISEGIKLKQNYIDNVSILVLDIEKNEVLAYVGNLPNTGSNSEEFVDMIQANRSTGSLLKPFLYAASLDEGVILEKSFLPDYPIQMNGFQAENYVKKHDGLVPANRALKRSLNIPYAWLLSQYNIERFRLLLQQLNLSGINKSAEYYGIPLILGGGEASLWDLTNAYAFLGKTLNTHEQESTYYSKADNDQASFILNLEENKDKPKLQADYNILRAENIWITLNNLQEVVRPSEQGNWKRFSSNVPIAWKTGTSNGFKDAWAIGVNGQYAIGVWTGNSDGEGRPGIVGSKAAAPIFFRVLYNLNNHKWFQKPIDDMIAIPICSTSGLLASKLCPIDTTWISSDVQQYTSCYYHKKIFRDQSGIYEVKSQCYDMGKANVDTILSLTPKIAYYYKQNNYYETPPKLYKNCIDLENQSPINILYPEENIKIYQPRIGDGKRNAFVMKAHHISTNQNIHWHLDGKYLGNTNKIHEMKSLLKPGTHNLVILDDQGKQDAVNFEIVQ